MKKCARIYYHYNMSTSTDIDTYVQCIQDSHTTSPSTVVTGTTPADGSVGLPGTGHQLESKPLPLGVGPFQEAPPGDASLCTAACGHPASHPFQGFPLAFPPSSLSGSPCAGVWFIMAGLVGVAGILNGPGTAEDCWCIIRIRCCCCCCHNRSSCCYCCIS